MLEFIESQCLGCKVVTWKMKFFDKCAKEKEGEMKFFDECANFNSEHLLKLSYLILTYEVSGPNTS